MYNVRGSAVSENLMDSELLSQMSWEKNTKLQLVACCLSSQGPPSEGRLWAAMAGLVWHVPAGGRAPVKQCDERLVMVTEHQGVLTGIQKEMCMQHRWVVAVLGGFQMRQVRAPKAPPVVNDVASGRGWKETADFGSVIKK